VQGQVDACARLRIGCRAGLAVKEKTFGGYDRRASQHSELRQSGKRPDFLRTPDTKYGNGPGESYASG
jgi:hypothetical protein